MKSIFTLTYPQLFCMLIFSMQVLGLPDNPCANHLYAKISIQGFVKYKPKSFFERMFELLSKSFCFCWMAIPPILPGKPCNHRTSSLQQCHLVEPPPDSLPNSKLSVHCLKLSTLGRMDGLMLLTKMFHLLFFLRMNSRRSSLHPSWKRHTRVLHDR